MISYIWKIIIKMGNVWRNDMEFIKKNGRGILVCLCIAVPSWLLGKQFPIIGGPVIAIIAGMIITLFLKDKAQLEGGIK